MKKLTAVVLFLSTIFIVNVPSLQAVNCEECCKDGRFVNRECCIQCNGCLLSGQDGSVRECADYPE